MKKRACNPTALADYAKCPYSYWVKHVLGLDTRPYVDPKRELGTLVHACEASVELGETKAYVEREMRRIRTQAGYRSIHTPMLERLKLEAWKITNGGVWVNGKNKKMRSKAYNTWAREEIDHKGYHFEKIEERFWEEVGPLILTPRLDRVLIDDKGQPWPYEVKLTGRWDENWKQRWKLDFQTTIQFLAVEAKYEKTPPGVMVEAILHQRQSSTKEENKKKLLPISKVERLELQWVRKPPEVVAHVRSWLEEIAPQMDERERSGNWPLSGMASRSCDFCSLRDHCSGDVLMKHLQPRGMDEMRSWNEKRKLSSEMDLPRVIKKKKRFGGGRASR